MSEVRVAATTAGVAEWGQRAERGRFRVGDPSVYEALRVDRALPVDPVVRQWVIADLQRWTHRHLLPLARVFSRIAVALIVAGKRILPFQFSWHRAIDVLGIWFLRRCVSREGGALLLRHFVVETNLINFVVRNCGAADVREATMRPTCVTDLGDEAVIRHDAAIYDLVIDLGRSRSADVQRPRHWRDIDFSSLEEVPAIDPDARIRRLVEIDIETALYLMNVLFCLFTTEDEYERAVNSFQLDESLLAYIANLTGDPVFRTWAPIKFPVWRSIARDVPRELYLHAAVNEYAHTRLREMRWAVGSGR